jgi:hypothetical protein
MIVKPLKNEKERSGKSKRRRKRRQSHPLQFQRVSHCQSGAQASVIKPIFAAGDAKKKISSQHKVRTSVQDRTLDSMFPVINPAQIGANSGTSGKADDSSPGILKPFDVKESECFLTSVRTLRQNLVKGKHRRMCLHYPVISLEIDMSLRPY